jgi:hypothetical protein
MLDAFIIEEIRRREQESEERRDQQRPRQELPLPQRPPSRRDEDEPASDRGVTIIDYSVDYAAAG